VKSRAIHPARVSAFAQLLSEEVPMMEAGRRLNLTKGETVSTMRRIRLELGAQAA